MTTFEGLIQRFEELLDQGRIMSAVEALEQARHLTTHAGLLAWARYNLGVAHWAKLGNGDAARSEFNAVVALFDQDGRGEIPKRMRGMLPYALDNAMLLALSFDEFEHLASRVGVLTPKSPTVTKLTPQTLKAREQGQPWSDQLFNIASGYYDRNNPRQDPGRYGEARSTYQLILSHRREFRLARDRWRMATFELAALSLRMATDSMQARKNSAGTYSHEEFLPILADAIPFLDEYLAANPGDDTLETVRRRAHGFIASIHRSGERANPLRYISRNPYKMIMMKCPKTGKAVKTGVNSRYFEQWQDNPPPGGASFTCPECSQKHTFDKSNTWLEDL